MNHEHDLRARLVETGANVLRARRLTPGISQLVDIGAVRPRESRPTFTELASHDGEDALARRKQVHDGRLERGGARCGEQQDVVLSPADLLQPPQRAEHDRTKVRAAMVKDGLRSGSEHLGRNRRRPRRHQIPLSSHVVRLPPVIDGADHRANCHLVTGREGRVSGGGGRKRT